MGQWPIFHGSIDFAFYRCRRLKLLMFIKKWYWPRVFVPFQALAIVYYTPHKHSFLFHVVRPTVRLQRFGFSIS